jgi:hypothetical protein
VCRQGERSVDKALWSSWPKLTAYYRGSRLAAVKRVIEQLRHLSSNGACDPLPCRDELTRMSRRPGPVKYLFRRWLSVGKREWSIPSCEVRFTAGVLHALAQLIDQVESPDPHTLVELRMDLYTAQWLLRGHCCGLAELARAADMEHFNQSDHLVTITLADLIRQLDGDHKLPDTHHDHS